MKNIIALTISLLFFAAAINAQNAPAKVNVAKANPATKQVNKTPAQVTHTAEYNKRAAERANRNVQPFKNKKGGK